MFAIIVCFLSLQFDLDKYSKYKYFKIEGNLLLLLLFLITVVYLFFLTKFINVTVFNFIFSFTRVKFSSGRIHVLKIIKKLYNSLFIYSIVKFFLLFK